MAQKPLDPAALYRAVAPDALAFATTRDLDPLDGPLGQERALEAIAFGARMPHPGYNIFVLAPPNARAAETVRAILEARAKERPAPPDIVYVNDFAHFDRPRALNLPSGGAPHFRARLERLVRDLSGLLGGVFESGEYLAERRAAESDMRERADAAIGTLHREAEALGTRIVHTPEGVFITVVRDGRALEPEELAGLPAAERAAAQARIAATERKVEEILEALPRLERELAETIESLNRAFAEHVLTEVMKSLRAELAKVRPALAYLDALTADVLDNLGLFVPQIAAQREDDGLRELLSRGSGGPRDPRERYAVTVLATNDPKGGAPVVTADHPALANLVGRIEHRTDFGGLVTDIRLIRPGALHAANGGFLVIDAERLLEHPLSYPALKRALQVGDIRIETQTEFLALSSGATIEAEPVPLDVKVVLVGEPWLFYALSHEDASFGELFKVQADFAQVVKRTRESERLYARLLAGLVARNNLLAFDVGAVARVIEQGSRAVADVEKLSVLTEEIADLAREADFHAREAGSPVVRADHVRAAMRSQTRRADRYRELAQESILREFHRIETDGTRVGQINGLSVYHFPHIKFGVPTRVTARIRVGQGGQVQDIERASSLGGRSHAKGVMILAAYLTAQYRVEQPPGFAASLAFEQSYGTDGDSASVAQLLALLSALIEVSLSQSLAITGALSQLGEVQAIGGVNHKIEGFFDICAARGLDGGHGVVIPEANVPDLMLKEEVIEAVRARKFSVYAVSTVDQALELFSGQKAGGRGAGGRFPRGSLNARIEERLVAMADAARGRAPPKRRKGPWAIF